ncbi:MAG: hypothetical protein GY869_30385, partial [Planctomycetes bacterium]|nr:hypothetical protein [Planctomycetota bacterium]
MLSKGGAERSTFELASCLSERDLDVTVLAGKVSCDQEKDLLFRLETAGVSGGTKVSYWRNFQQAVSDHLKNHEYDV